MYEFLLDVFWVEWKYNRLSVIPLLAWVKLKWVIGVIQLPKLDIIL